VTANPVAQEVKLYHVSFPYITSVGDHSYGHT